MEEAKNARLTGGRAAQKAARTCSRVRTRVAIIFYLMPVLKRHKKHTYLNSGKYIFTSTGSSIYDVSVYEFADNSNGSVFGESRVCV